MSSSYIAYIEQSNGTEEELIESVVTGIIEGMIRMLRDRAISEGVDLTTLSKTNVRLEYNGEQIANCVPLSEWNKDIDILALHEKHKKIKSELIDNLEMLARVTARDVANGKEPLISRLGKTAHGQRGTNE